MEVILNGANVDTEANTLEELIAERKIDTAGIAVAIGTSVVRRSDWGSTALFENMAVTVIRATQGG